MSAHVTVYSRRSFSAFIDDRSRDHAIIARTARDALMIELFQERDSLLAGDAEELFEYGNAERRMGTQVRAHLC